MMYNSFYNISLGQMETASQDLLFPGNSSKNLLDECKGLAVEGFKEFRCETKEFATPTADPSPTLASSSVREAEINSQWDTEKESALNIRHKTIFNKRLCERECICTSVLRGYLVWLYVCVREREKEKERERQTGSIRCERECDLVWKRRLSHLATLENVECK